MFEGLLNFFGLGGGETVSDSYAGYPPSPAPQYSLVDSYELPTLSGSESYSLQSSSPSSGDFFGSGSIPSSLDLSGYEIPTYGGGYTSPANKEHSDFYKSLTSPAVLGALVTSGASLLGGMSNLSAQKEALKAQMEEKRMNQMLELAKLKYQLMGKGAGGGGRRSGGGGANQAQQINADASARLASGYQSLGGNLASIYR